MQRPAEQIEKNKNHYHDQFDKSKHNYLQKCFYVINLMKNKDYDLWENFHAQYCNTKPEESWELYMLLTEEYQKLIAPRKKTRTVKSSKIKVKSRTKKAA
jgi:hypothetical protein